MPYYASTFVRKKGLYYYADNDLPFSLRKFLHADKTFKNCVSAIFLPVKPAEARSMSTGELAARQRVAMKAQMGGNAGNPSPGHFLH